MSSLPTGTVTFLFTDIEGSTRLLQEVGDTRASQFFDQHRQLLREAFAAGGGHELQDQGDGFLVVFQRAQDALLTAISAQRAMSRHSWPDGVRLLVRMGLHTGEPVVTAEGYVGVDVHRAARICAAAHGGQVLLSQTTRDLVEYYLPDGVELRDLGAQRLKDLQRPEKVFQVVHPDLPGDFLPLRSLDRVPNNLPLQLTTFIGRERELPELRRLLSTTRLLTLTGAGGSGKTRLALHVAADMLDSFPEGVWFVEMGRLSDPAGLPQGVASVLHVQEEGGRPLIETLADFLRPRTLLIVLDNCEHLLEAAVELVTRLLRIAPGLRFLATSREGLGIAGETTYYVPPLSLPAPGHSASAGQIAGSGAVRLFVDRAAARQPDFELTDDNAQAVAEICRRLDGMPLAIELAAARVSLLTVEQIAARLDDPFRLLTAGDRTAPPQHRTLRAAMDWSYQLLADAEQTVFRRLAVCAGGFTLEAAEAICAGDRVSRSDVFDLLTRLVNQSLVDTEHGREVRYRLLEPVREYAREKLSESAEMPITRARHRDWCLELAERGEPEIIAGPNQREWLRRLRVEDANLRAALEWSHSEQRGTEAMLRLAGGLWWYWFTFGQWNEAREWLQRALARPDSSASPARVKALYGLAFVLWLHGDPAQATELAQRSLALCREVDDKWGTACSIFILGVVATERGDTDRAVALLEEDLDLLRILKHPQGIAMAQFYLGYAVAGSDYPRATELFEKSLEVARAAGDKRGTAVVLGTLGDAAWFHGDYGRAAEFYRECEVLGRELGYEERIAYSLLGKGGLSRSRGEYDEARTLVEASLAIYRKFTWKTGVALCLRRLGMIALEQGDLAQAQSRLEETLSLFQDMGQKSHIGDVLDMMGVVARHRGDLDRAETMHQQALALFREAKDRLGIAGGLLNLGKVAQHRNDAAHAARCYSEALATWKGSGFRQGVAEAFEALGTAAVDARQEKRGARLLGAAEALRESIGAVIPLVDRIDYDRAVAAVRAALGDTTESTWAEGRAMSLDQAVEYVLRGRP